MSDLSGQLRLRPTRIGFLVRPTDMASIRRIMRLNTCLWGGVYNPIIPVCRILPTCWKREPVDRMTGKELADGYLDFFQPDVFVEATAGLANSCGIADDGGLSSDRRLVSLDEFVVAEEGRRPEFFFGLSVFDLYRKLFKEEFRFVAEHDRHVTLCEGKSPHMPFFEVISGGFPTDKDLQFIRDGYVDAFKADISSPNGDEMLRVAQRSVRTPIGFTKYGLEKLPHGSWDPVVFVCDPKSPTDIVDLWNLRLYRSNVLPFNVHWLDQCKDFLRDFISENHRPLPRNPHGVMIRTTVEIGRSIDHSSIEDTIKETLSGLPSGSWALKLWYDPIWRKERSDAVSHVSRIDIESSSTDLDLPVDKEGKPSIRFRSLSPEFAERFGGPAARWVNVLTIRNYGRADNWALTLPSTTKTDSYPNLGIGESILVTREGFVLRQHYKDSREYLRLLSGRDAIVDWLKNRSIDAKSSESGRITDQVISAVDGFWGTHIFAHEETLELLDKMSKSVKTYADGETVEEYPDRTASVEEWRQLIRRRAEEFSLPTLSIDSFVNAGVLKLGLELNCPNCEKKNWYSISGLAERVTCERCLKEFSFPQGTLDFSRTPWRFRVAGPFSVPDFAGGAYATALALRCLVRGLGSGDQSVTYSTNLDLAFNNLSVEIDFACWYRRDWFQSSSEEPVFVIGEAKSFAQDAVTDDDVRRMKQVAQQIPGAIIVFAVLKRSLSTAEKARLKTLAIWGRYELPDRRQRAPVIVLTGTELFAHHYVSTEWKDAGGIRSKLIEPGYVHLDNLVTFADFSQQAYLGLPSYWSWLEKRFKKKTSRKTGAKKKVMAKKNVKKKTSVRKPRGSAQTTKRKMKP